MCNECDATKGWKFCPHCGAELKQESKQESKQSMSQEEFDEIFLDMLKDARKVVWLTSNGTVTKLPSCRFELRTSDNVWMFDIRLDSERPHFWFSTSSVEKFFSDKYGLQCEDIQRLMKKQAAELFKLNDDTPRRLPCNAPLLAAELFKLNDDTPPVFGCRTAFLVAELFKLNDVTPIDSIKESLRRWKTSSN